MPGIETKDGNVIFIAPNKGSFVREKTHATNDGQLSSMTDDLDNQVGNQAAGVEDIVATGDATSLSAEKVAAAGANLNKVSAIGERIVASLPSGSEKIAETVTEGGAAHVEYLNAEVGEMTGSLNSAFAALKATLSNQQKTLIENYQAKLITANTVASTLAESADNINSDISKYEACSDKGLLYQAAKGKCGDPKIDPKKILNKVYHRMFKNDDGRDNGYVNERYVAFQKYNDDTYMRVFYYDNFRVHGHHTHAMWNVMICDANGNGCDHCSEPGRLHNWRWSAHQSNWWMLDHVGQTVTGLCKKGGSRDLRKGNYQLKVYIDQNYYDMYTGSNTQQSNFMVDEVMKY